MWSIFEKTDHLMTWSTLKAIGGSYLGALTILTPVMGYLLLVPGLQVSFGGIEIVDGFSISALGTTLSPNNRLLYIGLFIIGIATIFFRMCCPKEVAEHRNLAAFITSEKSIYSSFRLKADQAKATDIVKASSKQELREYLEGLSIKDSKKVGSTTTPLSSAEWWGLYEQPANVVLKIIYEERDACRRFFRLPIGVSYGIGLFLVLWPSFINFWDVVTLP